jgi:soluble lytic murein transglycosylase-like protein
MRVLILFFLFLLPSPAFAGVFSRAAGATGVPVKLLKSVAYVESGFKPYALDISGEPYFAKRYATAYYIARYFISQGYSVDVGLMQVNYNIWAKRLGVSLRQLLIPQNNALVGAYILGRYIAKRNNVFAGVGEYHSGNPYAARIYENKVLAVYEAFK